MSHWLKNSFYILVTSSEITDMVQIKHTFKVRIFRGLSRKGITLCSKRKSTPHSRSRLDMYFWQPLLSGTMQKTFLPSLVPHCASSPHTSVVAASCATCPQPTQGTKQTYLGNPLLGYAAMPQTLTAMLYAVAHCKQSKEQSAPTEDILFGQELIYQCKATVCFKIA